MARDRSQGAGATGWWAPRLAVVASLACAAVLAGGASSAHAAGYAEIGSFGEEGSGAGQLKEPRDGAVNEVTHDLYVADTGNNRVEEFTAQGAFVLMFGKEVNETKKTNVCTQVEIETEGVTCKAGEAGSASGEADFTEPKGVAVDNSGLTDKEDVYVTDAGNNRVEVFSSSGAYITEFDGKETPEIEGSKSFSQPWGLAVDGNGDVYVAERGHDVVDKFSPLGTAFLSTPYLTGLDEPTSVAIDSRPGSEAIYVGNHRHNVEKFNYATGAPEGPPIDPSEYLFGVAVNMATGDIYISEEEPEEERIMEPFMTRIKEFSATGALLETFGSFPGPPSTAVAVDSSTGTVYAVLHEGDKVEAFSSTIVLPTSITGASSAQSASAMVEGEVNPNGVAITECRFDYGITAHYGQHPPALCSHPSASEVGEGTSPVKVSAELTGLTPNQTYHYRLVAANASASKRGEDGEFTTDAVSPTVNDRPPSVSGITRTTVLLSGTINPEHSATTYHFVYGTTTAYGSNTTQASAGSGFGDEPAGPIELTGLQAGTTYHYALVASNPAGTSTTSNEDDTFTTAPRTPPLVSTGAASGVTQTRATVSGTVDPRGLQTSYEFELGTVIEGQLVYNGARVFGSAGTGTGAETIKLNLDNLAPGVTYHYRIAATNADGTEYGADQSFTTGSFPAGFTLPAAAAFIPYISIAELDAREAQEGRKATIPPKPLTKAQKLTKALEACKKDKSKKKRKACEKQARRKYAPAKSGAKKKH